MNRRRFIADAIAVSAAAWATSGIAVSETLATQPPVPVERLVRLGAKPAQLDMDLTKTAVIVVDMQNDFCSKGGVLDHEGVDLAIVRRIIAPTRSVLTAARRSGLKVVYSKMGFNLTFPTLVPGARAIGSTIS